MVLSNEGRKALRPVRSARPVRPVRLGPVVLMRSSRRETKAPLDRGVGG